MTTERTELKRRVLQYYRLIMTMGIWQHGGRYWVPVYSPPRSGARGFHSRAAALAWIGEWTP